MCATSAHHRLQALMSVTTLRTRELIFDDHFLPIVPTTVSTQIANDLHDTMRDTCEEVVGHGHDKNDTSVRRGGPQCT